jgi:DNA-binding CsgD family transcriptional regulator
MNRKIFIIHSSEIIRKGINTILRSYFNAEIIMLEKTEELKAFCELKGREIVIIGENITAEKINDYKLLQKNNEVKWIDFINENEDRNEPLPFCKFYITPQTGAAQLQKMISRCLHKTRKQTQANESEELSVREKEVLKLVALGHSNKVIAEKLFISIHTVISHRKNITEKTGIKSISGLTVYAILNNLIDTENINPEDLI